MKDDISKLEELLNPGALVETEADEVRSGKGKVELSDIIKQTKKKYRIHVKNLPNDTLVIKADENFSPRTIIDCQNNKGFCRRADYILVNEDETVFVELKHGKINAKRNIIEQLMGAQCLMDYLISIGRRFNHSDFSKITSTKQHFVVIGGFKPQKRPTGSMQLKNKSKPGHESNDSPEKMARIRVGSSDSLDYRQLLSGSG